MKVNLTYDAGSINRGLNLRSSLEAAKLAIDPTQRRDIGIQINYGSDSSVAVVKIDAPNKGRLEAIVNQYVRIASTKGVALSYVRPGGTEAYAAVANALKSLGLSLGNFEFFDLKRWSGYKSVMPLESLANN
ncbi:hypothetical protein HYV83_03775 [Candidatus Woesearchaeota archaeon]|nr:hypothetical protein [Candidatus Woesearchaeota archaeon]